jgi:hypothetical protein
VCASSDSQSPRPYDALIEPLYQPQGIEERWQGTWEAWIRDSAIADDHDVVARCEGAEPTPTPLIPPAGAAW